jgi:hypothetical protein
MSRKPATIISDSACVPASSQAGDFHDVTGHHRYYGSSACNGGERLAETRRGQRPRFVNLFGF